MGIGLGVTGNGVGDIRSMVVGARWFISFVEHNFFFFLAFIRLFTHLHFHLAVVVEWRGVAEFSLLLSMGWLSPTKRGPRPRTFSQIPHFYPVAVRLLDAPFSSHDFLAELIINLHRVRY